VLDHPRITRRPLPGGRGLLWPDRQFGPAARRDGVDVLFCPAYTCPLRAQAPRVTAVHDFSFFSLPEDFSFREGLRRRLLVTASLRVSRTVVACSDFTRREILRRCPELEGQVSVVPLGADDDLPPPPDRTEARRRLGVEGPLVLTVGAIFNRRRLPTLLRAVCALRPRHPGLRLEVVGENRTQPELDLHALVRRLGIADAVRLAGFLPDPALADRYAAADAAVFLSEYEGFGLPVLEAMARGLPVVLADRPALNELFGAAALLVDPRDETAVAAALERALRDSGLRADLVARGRTLAARFSWEETARHTRAALAAALRRSA
jgi:glycosyltransferase involved in cell wall biosynthesis